MRCDRILRPYDNLDYDNDNDNDNGAKRLP